METKDSVLCSQEPAAGLYVRIRPVMRGFCRYFPLFFEGVIVRRDKPREAQREHEQ
jgi:hypothetical protein